MLVTKSVHTSIILKSPRNSHGTGTQFNKQVASWIGMISDNIKNRYIVYLKVILVFDCSNPDIEKRSNRVCLLQRLSTIKVKLQVEYFIIYNNHTGKFRKKNLCTAKMPVAGYVCEHKAKCHVH